MNRVDAQVQVIALRGQLDMCEHFLTRVDSDRVVELEVLGRVNNIDGLLAKLRTAVSGGTIPPPRLHSIGDRGGEAA